MTYQPPYRITVKITNLLADIAEMLGKIKAIDSIRNTPKLRKKNQIKTITGTLQIEGNTLSEEKVTALLEGKRVLGTPKEIAEVQGAIAVYEQLPRYNCCNMDHLLEAHQLMMGQILTRAGQFRSESVGVYGEEGVSHIAPLADRVPVLMAELFAWLRQTKEHPLISSSVFHYEFEFIHPFIDGNGRIGRLWQTLILSKWKPLFYMIPVESVIRDYQQDYYQALQQSGCEGESTIFVEYMLKVILQTIQENAPVNAPANAPVNIEGLKTPEAVTALVKQNPEITRQKMAERIGKDIRTIGRAIKKLQENGRLRRVGSAKAGYWELL